MPIQAAFNVWLRKEKILRNLHQSSLVLHSRVLAYAISSLFWKNMHPDIHYKLLKKKKSLQLHQQLFACLQQCEKTSSCLNFLNIFICWNNQKYLQWLIDNSPWLCFLSRYAFTALAVHLASWPCWKRKLSTIRCFPDEIAWWIKF